MTTTPQGTRQISMYVPRDLLDAVDSSVKDEYDGNLRKRTDWIIDAMTTKLGIERDARLVAIENVFNSTSDKGREWLLTAAELVSSSETLKE